jgi:hypothetical protein
MTAENKKNPLTRKVVGKKFGSRKCHFAMTQAFSGQMANGVSRRNFDGLKTPNPSSFGHRVCLDKKVVGKNPNGVSAKCAIARRPTRASVAPNPNPTSAIPSATTSRKPRSSQQPPRIAHPYHALNRPSPVSHVPSSPPTQLATVLVLSLLAASPGGTETASSQQPAAGPQQALA